MFDFFQIFSLAPYGDEKWKDCYLKFRAFGVEDVEKFSAQEDVKESTEATKIIVSILEDKFVEGKAVKDGEVIDVKKEDLKTMPVQVLSDAVTSFQRPAGLDEKKKIESEPSSEE